MAQNTPPRAKNTCLSIQNGLGSLLEKRVFDPFLTLFWSQNGPFLTYFGIFHGPKRATTGSKRAKNTCLSIPSGPGTTLEKIIFFAPGTLVDPPLAPTVRGLAGPPAAPSDHWYGGLRGSLGDSEAWKPQKVGGCGWTRCPRNSFLSHVAQDTARSWFRGAGAHCAVFGAFWRLFGPFLGHIVELEGTKGPLVTRKSSRTWSVAAVCLHLAVLNPYWGCFGRKWLFLAQSCADLGGHLPTWRHRPGPPPVSFWLKTWIWQGHHLGSRMAKGQSGPRRWEGAMAKTARRRVVVVACLLAC